MPLSVPSPFPSLVLLPCAEVDAKGGKARAKGRQATEICKVSPGERIKNPTKGEKGFKGKN